MKLLSVRHGVDSTSHFFRAGDSIGLFADNGTAILSVNRSKERLIAILKNAIDVAIVGDRIWLLTKSEELYHANINENPISWSQVALRVYPNGSYTKLFKGFDPNSIFIGGPKSQRLVFVDTGDETQELCVQGTSSVVRCGYDFCTISDPYGTRRIARFGTNLGDRCLLRNEEFSLRSIFGVEVIDHWCLRFVSTDEVNLFLTEVDFFESAVLKDMPLPGLECMWLPTRFTNLEVVDSHFVYPNTDYSGFWICNLDTGNTSLLLWESEIKDLILTREETGLVVAILDAQGTIATCNLEPVKRSIAQDYLSGPFPLKTDFTVTEALPKNEKDAKMNLLRKLLEDDNDPFGGLS